MDSRISKAGVYPAQILRSIEELKKPEQEEQIKTGLFPSVSFDADNMDIIDLGFVEGTESGPVPFPNQNSKTVLFPNQNPVDIGSVIDLGLVEGTESGPVPFPNERVVDLSIFDENGNPIRYQNLSDLPKGTKIVKNADGTYSATIYADGWFIEGFVPSVKYNFDENGNLMNYTLDKNFEWQTGSREYVNYDANGNKTGGKLVLRTGEVIELAANQEVSITHEIVDESADGGFIFMPVINIITTEELANPCIVDPSRTNVNKRVTTMKYDMDGVELGKNVTEEITNPKATVSLDYKKSNLCIYPAQYDITGGTISFENGETFDVPAGSKVSYQDGKIVVIAYTQDGIKKYILGNNGLESEENITLTLDPTPKPVVIESREIIQESIPKKMRQIFDNSNKLY